MNAISDFDRLIGHQGASAKVKFGGDPFDIDDDGIGGGHSTLKMQKQCNFKLQDLTSKAVLKQSSLLRISFGTRTVFVKSFKKH